MGPLAPTTVLRRAAELEVRVTSTGDTTVILNGGAVSCGPHGLAILDAFSEPCALAEALERLGPRARGAQDWIDLTSSVARLHDARILREKDDPELDVDVAVGPAFDNPAPHVAMLEDRVRTSAFLAALEEVVGRDDVVLDIGTGSGVLAAGAARAGARRVYAIEASAIGRHARAVFAANRLDEQVTLVEGWSTRATLPERADVAVAEILGSEALEERMLPVLLDARNRLLKPDARLIPSLVRIFVVLVSVPDDDRSRVTFTGSNTARWSSWYGLDLTPLSAFAARLQHRVTVPIDDARGWERLSRPVRVAEFDLSRLETLAVDVVLDVVASSSGVADGAIGYFEAQLSPNVAVSTDPANDLRPISWGTPVWLFPEPLELRRGDELRLRYEFSRGRAHVRLLYE
jgi:precorrin-6B methylase 2